MNIEINNALVEFRELLHQDPGARVWETLWERLQHITTSSVVLLYLQDHLRSWPDALRNTHATSEREFAELCRHQGWPLVRSLHLHYPNTSYEMAQRIANSSHLRDLTALNLADSGLGTDGVLALAESTQLTNLKTLDLTGNRVGDEGLQALARSPYLTQLTTLILKNNQIGADGIAALAQSSSLTQLESLQLGWNQLSEEGAQVLAGATNLRHLTFLDLQDNALGDAGAAASDAPCWYR